MKESIEVKNISEAKMKLLELEKENKYLFHGSPNLINELEPRQPTRGENEKHGKISICATPYADIAIFRSIVNPQNSTCEKHFSGFGLNQKKENVKFKFETTIEVLNSLKNKSGYVYVLNKDLFRKKNKMEWRTENKITPLEVLKVSFNDLPTIEIIKDKKSI